MAVTALTNTIATTSATNTIVTVADTIAPITRAMRRLWVCSSNRSCRLSSWP